MKHLITIFRMRAGQRLNESMMLADFKAIMKHDGFKYHTRPRGRDNRL